MKSILIAFIKTLLIFVVTYILISFILWEYNPYHWEGNIIIPFWAFLRIGIFAFILNYINIKKI